MGKVRNIEGLKNPAAGDLGSCNPFGIQVRTRHGRLVQGFLRPSIINSSLLALSVLCLANMGWGANQGASGNSLREHRNRPGVERLLTLLESDRIRSYLGLADPQVERLRQIVVETEKVDVKTAAEIEVRNIDLREALRSDKPDRDEILKQVQEISDLRRERMKRHVEAILAAKAVLSPEQQRKLFSLLENRRARWRVGEGPQGVPAKPLPRPGAPPAGVTIHPGEPPVQ